MLWKENTECLFNLQKTWTPL